jgi:hypothetical protein
MDLPPEILDEILEHIPMDLAGRQTMIGCALVATWWVRPSQKRLFSSVAVTMDNYHRWMTSVVFPVPRAHLLEHVRSLWQTLGRSYKLKYRIRDLPRYSGKYLSALRNLHALTLHNAWVDHSNEERFHACFSAFRGTLTHLSLEHTTASLSTFATLVDYFPNITTLEIRSFELAPDYGRAPTLSRPLRGKIHIGEVDSLEFFNQFAKLDLKYEELEIDPLSDSLGIAFLDSALQISPSTVKYLRLGAPPECE